MTTFGLILIIIGGLILMGPLMMLFARLNNVDPFITDKIHSGEVTSYNITDQQEKSLLIVGFLHPLFVPLWLETKLIKKLLK